MWQSVTTVIDGVAFTVLAGVGAPGGQRQVIHVHVRARAVDGRCHGIVVEPLRLRRLDYHMRGTNGGLRVSRGRSSCIHDVRWLQGQTVVELHDEVSLWQYDDNSMVLERFEVGMWEVESSRPSWSLSPWLARVIVTKDTPDW